MHTANDSFAEGNRRLSEGRALEAISFYEQALAVEPRFVEAVSNLGAALAELGRHDEAVAYYDRALALRPDASDTHFNRGNSLVALGRVSDALTSFDAALQYNPDFGEAWTNRGVLLRRLGYVPEALECHRRALEILPRSTNAHSNFALCLGSLGRVDEALHHYDLALQLDPGNVGARCNRAQLFLLKGEFHRGWPEYESRWELERAQIHNRGLPRWDGSPLHGRSILLRHEQGLGDTIMFCRFAPLVRDRGGTVILECPRRLHRLMSTCAGVAGMADPSDALRDVDYEMPLMSLPGVFRTSFRTIPADVPYLRAEPERVERWRGRVSGGGIRIGVAWQGNPEFPEDAMRSIPLRHFAALALPNVRLISLQSGKGVEQLAALAGRLPIDEFGPDLDADGAFLDTAAIMMNLDLIISSDTAIVHLAGAIARPVWVALGTGPEWRWLRDRDDSPWYPTAQLFRQERFGDWDGVFARMREELTNRPPRPAT